MGGGQPPLAVAIINAYPDDNRGGAALTAAAIELAEATYGVDLQLSLVPVRRDAKDAFRHTLELRPDIEVTPPIVSLDGGMPRTVAAVVGFTLSLLLGRPVLGTSRAGWNAVARADVVLSRGGVIFVVRSRRLDVVLSALARFAPALVAVRLRRPLALVGAQIGVDGAPPVIERLLLGPILRGADIVLARGPRSVARARSITAGANVCELPDSTLTLPPVDERSSKDAAERLRMAGVDGRYLVCVCRTLDLPPRAAMVDIAREAAARAAIDHVVVLCQVDGGNERSDRPGTLALLADLQAADIAASFLDVDAPVDLYRALLGGSVGVVSTRMHSVILATGMGVPALAVIFGDADRRSVGDAYRKSDVLRGIGFEERLLDPWAPAADRVDAFLAQLGHAADPAPLRAAAQGAIALLPTPA